MYKRQPICRKERRKQGKLARSGVKWPRACIHQTRDEAINTVVQNDRIAAEVVVDRVSADGQAFEQRIAIFLTFDNDGKIITDHTYAGTTNLEALVPYLPEDGQKALKAIIENQ